MIKVKSILIPALALALLLGGVSSVFAKEKENKGKNTKKNLIEQVIPFLSNSSTYVATSTPETTPTPSTTPTTTPTVSPTPTITPSVSPSPVATTTPPVASTTPPVVGNTNNNGGGKSGEVNATLANGFFGSNYYGNNGFGSGATRVLVVVGSISALLGFVLLSGKTFRTPRLYS